MPHKVIEDARKEVMMMLVKEIKPFFRKSSFIDTIEFGVGDSHYLYGFCSDGVINGKSEDSFYDELENPELKKLTPKEKERLKQRNEKLANLCQEVSYDLSKFNKKIDGIEDAFVRLFGHCWIKVKKDGSWTFGEWK